LDNSGLHDSVAAVVEHLAPVMATTIFHGLMTVPQFMGY
jgi:hypothetical protein